MTLVPLMSALTSGLLAAFALFIGGVMGWIVGALREPPEAEEPALERSGPATVNPQIIEVLAVLRTGALVCGPHDEVLHATSQARAFSLVRGDRVLLPEVLDAVRTVRRDERMQAFDVAHRRSPSAPVQHLNIRATYLGFGQVLVLAEDRTPQLRVEETRRDFVTNVSHELKTPIGAIQLLSEAVEGAADEPEAVRHFAGRMRSEAARLGELVAQIIALSRLQADDPMLQAQPVVVTDIIGEALARTRELAESHAVNVLRAGNEQVTVLGDATQLVDAVANLVQNAIVYSNENARVAVTTLVVDEDDPFVEISVADNGIGISAADQQRIFERFYRVDYARSRANGGTGLGLSIVKHIVAVHGGSVDLWSKPGQGSTFTLHLPLHVPVPGSEPEPETNQLTQH